MSTEAANWMKSETRRRQLEDERRRQAQIEIDRKTPSMYPPVRPPAVTNPTASKGEGAPIFDVNPEKLLRKLLGA